MNYCGFWELRQAGHFSYCYWREKLQLRENACLPGHQRLQKDQGHPWHQERPSTKKETDLLITSHTIHSDPCHPLPPPPLTLHCADPGTERSLSLHALDGHQESL